MAVGYNTITVTTSATEIMAANNQRKGLVVINAGSATVYIGPDSSITTSNAIPILANSNLTDSGFDSSWKGSIYGIVGSGTIDVRYWWWE